MDFIKTISLLHRKMNAELNVRLMEVGLSSAQTGLLKLIYANGQMTQTDLCEELEIDKSTVAKMLARLENNGFVTRTVNPDDTRSVLVSLTQKAIEINLQTKKIITEWTREVTVDLTDKEQEALNKMLNKVAYQAMVISNSRGK